MTVTLRYVNFMIELRKKTKKAIPLCSPARGEWRLKLLIHDK